MLLGMIQCYEKEFAVVASVGSNAEEKPFFAAFLIAFEWLAWTGLPNACCIFFKKKKNLL